MIGPVESYQDLDLPHDGRYLRKQGDLPRPTAEEMNLHAEAVADRLGVKFQKQEAIGAYLVIMTPTGRKYIERYVLYVLATPGEVLDGVRAIVERVHERFGSGQAWTLGGRVHVVSDDGMDVCLDLDNEPHLLLRAWTCHEHAPGVVP